MLTARQLPTLARGIRVALIAVVLAALSSATHCIAQQSLGDQAAQRLQQGASGKNRYRKAEAVPDMKSVVENMKKLFEPVLISGGSNAAEKDKWYSPHLRDTEIGEENKTLETKLRAETIPIDNILLYCINPFNTPIKAACPVTIPSLFPGPYNPENPDGDVCYWHGQKFSPHRPIESCLPRNTRIYGRFTEPSNFKACCVRQGEQAFTSEQVASLHSDGDGWAGLFEFYYPVSAIGWENDRTTTMIADKDKVKQCFDKANPLMENRQAQKWVADAIARNQRAAGGVLDGEGQESSATLRQEVSKLIKDVRPKEEENRFSDSLQSEGLTMRPNLAALDPEYRRNLAKHFCMHPDQFGKIMNEAAGDNVQRGGGESLESLDKIPVWSNYCPEGVELMTDPKKSELRNIDNTPTDFMAGMKAWKSDPLYCQRMHLTDPNMSLLKLDEVIRRTGRAALSQEAVGHTCLDNDKLNGGMVPVTLNRHASVERRGAIADHVVGFMIAGGLAETMRTGQRSYLKRFEPQPYLQKLPETLRPFVGTRFAGTGTNELIRTNPEFSTCTSLSGEDYASSRENKADRLYISNLNHKPFTQQMIDEKNTIDKYRQEWADSQKEKFAEHGLDEKTQNYATAFRPMAMCPKGFVRWRPPVDEHEQVLHQILEFRCKEEYFGGIP